MTKNTCLHSAQRNRRVIDSSSRCSVRNNFKSNDSHSGQRGKGRNTYLSCSPGDGVLVVGFMSTVASVFAVTNQVDIYYCVTYLGKLDHPQQTVGPRKHSILIQP